MAHLIDKDALVAEIDKRQKILDLDSPFGRGGMVELEYIKGKVNTLEVKEVDLEKEYKDFIKQSDNGRSMFETAKHFFALGLKAKQG